MLPKVNLRGKGIQIILSCQEQFWRSLDLGSLNNFVIWCLLWSSIHLYTVYMRNQIFFFIVNNLFLYLHRERVVVHCTVVVAAIASSFFGTSVHKHVVISYWDYYSCSMAPLYWGGNAACHAPIQRNELKLIALHNTVQHISNHIIINISL